MREQKDRIKAITHERKPNIEELRSRLNADAAVNRGGRVKAKYHLDWVRDKDCSFCFAPGSRTLTTTGRAVSGKRQAITW